MEPPEIFRVTLPGQRMAVVAPGETTPKHLMIHDVHIEGPEIRYVQLSKDLSEISGLGLTNIVSLVTFVEPATFRIKRMPNGTIRVTTNTGLSFADQWLKEKARCIEALTLDQQWFDVTTHCQSNAIPSHLVQQWSDRNQRTLVDFRISI
jgi:hypothetical protein